MRFGKLVPFGVALALILSGCTSSTNDGGPNCPTGCPPNSTCDISSGTGVCVCFNDGGYAQCGTTDGGKPICVNTLSDNGNCGACGNGCPSPGILSSCLAGKCSCLINQCPTADGGTVCDDWTSDSQNCGGCFLAVPPSGKVCDVGQSCQNSVCICSPGFTSCAAFEPDGGPDGGNYCADTTTDKLNCGTCGNACPHDQKCTAQGNVGVCVCDTGEDGGSDLSPCSSGCVHLNSDPRNCGACNVQCETGICNNGTCLCNPDAGILQCSATRCADINSDVKNCGACGNDCTAGTDPSFNPVVCKSGQCRCHGGSNDICATPIPPFPTLACIDTSSDPHNCGGCGLVVDGGGPQADGGLPPSPYICTGVKSACQNGSCNCPNNNLYCGPGTWTPDAGANDGGICLNDTGDPFNCGGCGNVCSTLYAADAVCQFASCTCIDAGICLTAVNTDPFNPSCDCIGQYSPTPPDPSCASQGLSFATNIFPLLSNATVTNEPNWGQGSVLIGCAVSGCHSPGSTWVPASDAGAAAGLDFTNSTAAYQALAGGTVSNQTCNGVSTQVVNPSGICLCQSLVTSGDGAHSLLFQLLNNSYTNCNNPVGGSINPMPIDDGGTYHPLSACLATQVRQWIDQGALP